MDFYEALDDFLGGPWGAVAVDADAAGGMCRRTSLALLAHLERFDAAEGVEVWHLCWSVHPSRGPDGHGLHWLLARNGEAVDLTAAQFPGEPGGVRRSPLAAERGRWRHSWKVAPDDLLDPMARSDLNPDGIPPHWRDVLDAEPPGELDDWPYPCHTLAETSPWYRPLL